MRHTHTDTTHILRIDRGQDVIASITEFSKTMQIDNAYFNGIGAVDTATFGYYNLEEKKYHFTDYTEPLEVVSLTGNVMLKAGEPFVHVHGVFSNTKNETLGGHIVEMKVGVVLEVFLTPLATHIERAMDECTGLALMDIE